MLRSLKIYLLVFLSCIWQAHASAKPEELGLAFLSKPSNRISLPLPENFYDLCRKIHDDVQTTTRDDVDKDSLFCVAYTYLTKIQNMIRQKNKMLPEGQVPENFFVNFCVLKHLRTESCMIVSNNQIYKALYANDEISIKNLRQINLHYILIFIRFTLENIFIEHARANQGFICTTKFADDLSLQALKIMKIPVREADEVLNNPTRDEIEALTKYCELYTQNIYGKTTSLYTTFFGQSPLRYLPMMNYLERFFVPETEWLPPVSNLSLKDRFEHLKFYLLFSAQVYRYCPVFDMQRLETALPMEDNKLRSKYVREIEKNGLLFQASIVKKQDETESLRRKVELLEKECASLKEALNFVPQGKNNKKLGREKELEAAITVLKNNLESKKAETKLLADRYNSLLNENKSLQAQRKRDEERLQAAVVTAEYLQKTEEENKKMGKTLEDLIKDTQRFSAELETLRKDRLDNQNKLELIFKTRQGGLSQEEISAILQSTNMKTVIREFFELHQELEAALHEKEGLEKQLEESKNRLAQAEQAAFFHMHHARYFYHQLQLQVANTGTVILEKAKEEEKLAEGSEQ